MKRISLIGQVPDVVNISGIGLRIPAISADGNNVRKSVLRPFAV